jgi:hypothetical protein
VGVVSALLRFISYLFHGLFALLLLALGTVLTLANAGSSVRLEMLPWSGPTAIWVVLIGGLFGLFTVIMAIRDKLRPLFFLWALLVTIYLVKGYFLSNYHFTPEEFKNVVYLVVGSLIALLGAFIQLFHRPNKR